MNGDGFPSNDISIVLPSARVIRFYEQVVLREMGRAKAWACSIHYDTTIPASDQSARINEAKEVIEYFSRRSGWPDVSRAHASICSTPAQVEMKEIPEKIYLFKLSKDKAWTFVDVADHAADTT